MEASRNTWTLGHTALCGRQDPRTAVHAFGSAFVALVQAVWWLHHMVSGSRAMRAVLFNLPPPCELSWFLVLLQEAKGSTQSNEEKDVTELLMAKVLQVDFFAIGFGQPPEGKRTKTFLSFGF